MFRLSIYKLVISASVFLGLVITPELRAELKIYDDNTRKYVIRNVDPEAKDEEENRRYFSEVEFTTKTYEKMVSGKKMIVFERETLMEEGDRQELEFIYDAKSLIIAQTEEKVYTREGKHLKTETKIYSNHFVELEKNTFSPNMFPLFMQMIDFKVGDIIKCSMVFTPEFKPWTIILTVEDIEIVTVPAGTFECARVKIEYDTEDLPGFFKILPQFLIKRFITDFYIWVEMEEPHTMVKFQGKIHGFSSPEKVEELVEITKN
jgi:Protein of unknown function (DUF3108)